MALITTQQQNSVLRRPHKKRVFLSFWDRAFMVFISTIFSQWRDYIRVVRPETVIKWHKTLFRFLWRWRSKSPGRPMIPESLRDLIHRLARENTDWGPLRILQELAFLGHLKNVSLSTIKNYLRRFFPPGPTQRSLSWAAFLKNQAKTITAMDFFTIPTAFGNFLYGFVVLSHDRRKIIHTAVTQHPTAKWTLHQLREAFPFAAPQFLIRDNDAIFSPWFQRRVENMGIRQVPTAFHSPWQNPFCERVIGTIRRECFDHVIVCGEGQARTILK